jgi:hypothetical protein
MKAECKEMVDLLVRLTKEVYQVLDELIADSQFTLTYKSDQANCQGHDSSIDFGKYKQSLEKDMKYLLKMKAMDEEILGRITQGVSVSAALEMTEVVPVSGLAMAHLHILECELKTALDIWLPPTTTNKTTTEQKHTTRERGVQVAETPEFGSFVGAAPNSTTFKSDVVNSILSTRPTLASQECVTVMLIRHSFKDVKPFLHQSTSPPTNSRIRLGSSRAKLM